MTPKYKILSFSPGPLAHSNSIENHCSGSAGPTQRPIDPKTDPLRTGSGRQNRQTGQLLNQSRLFCDKPQPAGAPFSGALNQLALHYRSVSEPPARGRRQGSGRGATHRRINSGCVLAYSKSSLNQANNGCFATSRSWPASFTAGCCRPILRYRRGWYPHRAIEPH